MSLCLPEARTASLLAAIGWQGGTIHQIAGHTGLPVETLLYGEPPATASIDDYREGFFWGRRGTPVPFRGERYRGNVSFWLGVAQSSYMPDAVLFPDK